MFSKKHQRSTTVQDLKNEGRYHLLLLHKQVHDKRGIVKSLQAYIARVKVTACEVGIFVRLWYVLVYMAHLGVGVVCIICEVYV